MYKNNTNIGFAGLKYCISDINDVDSLLSKRDITEAKPVITNQKTNDSSHNQSLDSKQIQHKNASNQNNDNKSSKQNILSQKQSVVPQQNQQPKNSNQNYHAQHNTLGCIFTIIIIIIIYFLSLSNNKNQYNDYQYNTNQSTNSQNIQQYSDNSHNTSNYENFNNNYDNNSININNNLTFEKLQNELLVICPLKTNEKNNILSQFEIHWCIMQVMYLDDITNIIYTKSAKNEFNSLLNNFTSRCGDLQDIEKQDYIEAQKYIDRYYNQIIASIKISTQKQKIITKQVQELLSILGYKPGKADGIAGTKTINAVKLFQHNRNLKVTGIVDEELLKFITHLLDMKSLKEIFKSL